MPLSGSFSAAKVRRSNSYLFQALIRPHFVIRVKVKSLQMLKCELHILTVATPIISQRKASSVTKEFCPAEACGVSVSGCIIYTPVWDTPRDPLDHIPLLKSVCTAQEAQRLWTCKRLGLLLWHNWRCKIAKIRMCNLSFNILWLLTFMAEGCANCAWNNYWTYQPLLIRNCLMMAPWCRNMY